MRRWSIAGLLVATALVTASSAPITQQPGPLSTSDAVAHYARGEFDAAVRNLDTRTLKVAPFTHALDEWIAAGDAATRPRRRIVAAAFALDATWTATRTEFNGLRLCAGNRTPPISPERETLVSSESQPLVAHWAVQQLPATGSPGPAERWLWLAAVGIAEDCRASRPIQRDILPFARKRWPNEPRLLLAEVLARTNLELGPLRESWRRSDVLRGQPLQGNVKGRIPGAVRAFEPLLSNSTLAGEVALRIGYLELRRNQWPAALVRLDAARSKATEPILRATADYFAGWVFEQQDRPDEAITAYKRALAITPDMRNLATRLSALLYLRNERTEAYAILDRALNARPAPTDLMVLLERADARFVPEWIASMRGALK